MKRLLGCLFSVAFSLWAQGIDSPIVKLALPGMWVEHPEWVGGSAKQAPSAVPVWQVFYQPQSGEYADIGKNAAWNDGDADKNVQTLNKMTTNESGVLQPELQRILAKYYFPRSDTYLTQNADQIRSGKQLLPAWELKGIKGDVRSFYSSQLTPGDATRARAPTGRSMRYGRPPR